MNDDDDDVVVCNRGGASAASRRSYQHFPKLIKSGVGVYFQILKQMRCLLNAS